MDLHVHSFKSANNDFFFYYKCRIAKMSMAMASNKGVARASPFRESEWDRRLDGLLQDLENSTSSSTQVSESRQVSHSRVQHHNHQITKSRSACSLGTASVQNNPAQWSEFFSFCSQTYQILLLFWIFWDLLDLVLAGLFQAIWDYECQLT